MLELLLDISYVMLAFLSSPFWYLLQALELIIYVIIGFLYMCLFRLFPFLLTEVLPFIWNYLCSPIINILFFLGNYVIEAVLYIFYFILYPTITSDIGKLLIFFTIVYFLLKQSKSFFKQTMGPIILTIDLYFSPLLIPFRAVRSAFRFVYSLVRGDKKQTPEDNIPEFSTHTRPAEPTGERIRRRRLRSTNNEDGKCVVCFINQKCMLIRPCNHACLCIDCAKLLVEESDLKECPLCRGNIIRIERIYI
eukprot:TRINITY_DN6314_c0_g1_i1.p1 TRINITY_DN6314_c0_g1~~TRINITY_DN6314_c0_g1_i1.p1  ORF type:complete len:250 (+),score=29.00 TRINITY_DN6314_c0_g1_i1:148-897(+)